MEDRRADIDPDDVPQPAQANAQSFLKAGLTEIADLTDDADVGIVGVPFDGGVKRQPGSRFGPVAIREASAGYYAYFYNLMESFVNVDTGREFNWDDIELHDCGDVSVMPSRLDLTEPLVEEYVSKVAEHTLPIVLGGDHSITYPAYMGYAKAVDERVGIVHLDAHTDTGEPIAGVENHGTMFPRVHESEYGGYENHAMVGIRGYQSREFPEFADEVGLHVSYKRDVREDGIETCVERAIEHAADGVDHVYLTVDVDVVDPAYAPGTGSPRPGGLSSDELLRAMGLLGACEEIKAMDFVEVAPQLDPTTSTWRGVTQQVAVEAILAFIEAKFFAE